jgi:hypothetical protein
VADRRHHKARSRSRAFSLRGQGEAAAMAARPAACPVRGGIGVIGDISVIDDWPDVATVSKRADHGKGAGIARKVPVDMKKPSGPLAMSVIDAADGSFSGTCVQ